jgi:hypothetical protein
MLATSLLMVIFMFPETKWHRLHPNEIIKNAADVKVNSKDPPTAAKKEKVSEVDNDPAEKLGGTVTQTRSSTMPDLSHQATAERDPYLGKGTPSRAQWGIYTPHPNPLRTILLDLWIPWKLFAFPIVEFSAFVVSWSCSSFLTLNLTQSQNFAAPPYNYNSQSIGFFNFAILIGALFGLATAGPFSDWVSARATRKNRGIREPEMRLPAMSKSNKRLLRTCSE